MGALENFRGEQDPRALDGWMAEQNKRLAGVQPGEQHPLDSEQSKKRHAQLVQWYHQEREKQAPNRYQMAIDQDFYDNLQWDQEDEAELAERGQAAYVYNEVAPTIDWMIGTEKRTRIDYKVLPRNEEDVQTADVKTKALKYLSDVNKSAFARSLAAADAFKVGVGWIEDGARGDPTKEPIFSSYESWRNIIWDSSATQRDLTDARYLYRWKWIDLDLAIAMFPDREQQLRRASISANLYTSEEDDDFWYLGQRYQVKDLRGQVVGRRTFLSDSAMIDNRRARVKIIECWYRMPVRRQVVRGHVFNGQPFDKSNPDMVKAALQGVISLYDQLQMAVRVALMTENDLLQEMETPYRHDRFPFTPIWCYVRGRDRMPYGAIRRVRDQQEDLNKHGSKALWEVSSNRLIADVDALDGTGLTWDDIREEAARPDALLTHKKGAKMEFGQNTDKTRVHIDLMQLRANNIRTSGGVTDENLGRKTNAISGEAIRARQLQGSVVTAEVFDNIRFAAQISGEIQLSLAEQFITTPRAIRLTGARGKIDWVKINQPVVDPDGTVRFLNDITASQADFVVDEQDYHQSMRQAMFESLAELVGKISAINPEAGLRILRMAIEFSDFPNKDEIAGDIKKMLGLVDEGDLENMTPEQRAEYQQKQQQQQQQAQLQQATAETALKEGAAKVEKLLADAEKSRAQASEHLAKAISIGEQNLQAVNALAESVAELTEAMANVVPQQA